MNKEIFKISEDDYKTSLADIIHVAKKICIQKNLEYDPYKVFISSDEDRNVLVWIDSKGAG